MATNFAAPGAFTADIERELAVIAPLLDGLQNRAYMRLRLAELITAIFAAVSGATDVARLEIGAKAEVGRDFATLRRHLDALAEILDEKQSAHPVGSKPLSQRLREATQLVDVTETQLADIESIEIGLRLEMVVERALGDAVALLAPDDPVVASIESDVRSKLGLLSQEDLQTVWARITREVEFEPETDTLQIKLPADTSMVPRSFFGASGKDALKDLVAKYLVGIRPRLVHAAFANGRQTVPFSPLALSQVLTWAKDAATLSDSERRLVSHILLLSFLATRRLGVESRHLAAALRVPEEARLLKGQPERTTDKLVPSDATIPIAFAECRATVALLEALVRAAPEPEIQLLIRYKLAAEVELPWSRKRFEGKSEIMLQRTVCAFLIEHGTFAVGTKFGPSETDLVTGSMEDPLVIEVKLFKRAPAPRQIERAFIQLRGYMDQAPFKSRGALLLFNLSDVSMHAPKEFIGSRVAVVAVNLMREAPSSRDRHLEVRSGGTSGQPIEVISVGMGAGKRRGGQGG